jgi:hypothetical protein
VKELVVVLLLLFLLLLFFFKSSIFLSKEIVVCMLRTQDKKGSEIDITFRLLYGI